MDKIMTEAEVEALMASVQPQVDAADAKFKECARRIQGIVKEFGFSGFLLSVGFEPTVDSGMPLYLALATHRDTPGPEHLAALMKCAVDKADESLHGFADAPAPEPIAFKPRRGYV